MNFVKQLNFSIHENLVVKLHPVNKTKFKKKIIGLNLKKEII